MNTAVSLRSLSYLGGFLLLGACATPGPGYEAVMTNALPLPDNAVRITFLRPKDADDGSNGGAASIEANQARVGGLRYGGFFYVDVAAGTTVVTAFGRYRIFGTCEIAVTAAPGTRLYIDVGPRRSYMIAGAVGGALGGVAGASAVPNVYGGAAAAVAATIAGVAAGSATGTAAAIAVEGKGKPCRGPYGLELIAADDALPRLAELTWSGD